MAEELPPQGTVEIGAAGPDSHRDSYDHSTLDNLITRLMKGRKLPAWYEKTARRLLQELIKPKVTYRFADDEAVHYWTLTRVVTTHLWTLSTEMLAEPDNQELREEPWQETWSEQYLAIERLRAQFQAAAGGNFTFLGKDYQLKRQFPDIANHIYVYRRGTSVVYHGIKISTARAIMDAIEGPARKLAEADIDDFVCAFFAEPTRWPEEQMFNLLAIAGTRSDTQLTGDNGILPLASGSTWEARLNAPGREVPRRIVEYTTSIGLHHALNQELAGSSSPEQFALEVIRNMT
ncbi:hypothetical protein SAMN05443665_103727 [Actinomadura meyerae]|uniref:Uncharacterized protein n=1 Tax=Actinomadura meyerae TaxID=240840 RepID=A0A239N7H8_9ACTN|nr:hypothetical protein [Actinomadura meyerae]SNT50886.1 hypothetical protein SAMN05443665_103727 [Actinomadura meyerae]